MENKVIAKEYVELHYVPYEQYVSKLNEVNEKWKNKVIDKIKDFEWNKNKLLKEKGNIMKDAKIYSVIDILDAEISRFVELLEDK